MKSKRIMWVCRAYRDTEGYSVLDIPFYIKTLQNILIYQKLSKNEQIMIKAVIRVNKEYLKKLIED